MSNEAIAPVQHSIDDWGAELKAFTYQMEECMGVRVETMFVQNVDQLSLPECKKLCQFVKGYDKSAQSMQNIMALFISNEAIRSAMITPEIQNKINHNAALSAADVNQMLTNAASAISPREVQGGQNIQNMISKVENKIPQNLQDADIGTKVKAAGSLMNAFLLKTVEQAMKKEPDFQAIRQWSHNIMPSQNNQIGNPQEAEVGRLGGGASMKDEEKKGRIGIGVGLEKDGKVASQSMGRINTASVTRGMGE